MADTSWARSARLRVDLSAQQAGKHHRPLRVPDENDAPAVVVAGHVVLECRLDVAVCGQSRIEIDLAGLLDRGKRQLPVHRGIDAADLRQLSGLGDRDAALFLVDREIRVDGRLVADGRIDVEAVDRRIGRRSGRQGCRVAGRIDGSSVEIAGAGVVGEAGFAYAA
jgi:hypothetical protein